MKSTLPTLRVLSLNCWGLRFVSKQRAARISAIADWISVSSQPSSRSSYHSNEDSVVDAELDGYDFIGLQEIWCQTDFDLIRLRAKAAGLLHAKFFHSGAVGSGLGILSRHPIQSSFVHPYSLSGYPLHFIEGDFFAAKAVCGISINVQGIGKIQVLNTHLYAPGAEADGLEGSHRVAQAWELAKIVREADERGYHVVLLGDLNTQPQSDLIKNLLSHGGLHDAYVQTHDEPPPLNSPQHLSFTPLEALHAYGITADSPLNSWSAPKLAKKSRHDEIVIRGGKRLDYALYRSPESAPDRLVAESATVSLLSPVAGLGCSYSDHFGLEVILSLLPTTATTSMAGRPILDPPAPLTLAALSRSHSLLTSSYAHSISSSRSQLKILALTILLVPILAIAASFQPLNFLAWIFVLLGIANGAVGATMLYSGFVGGRWEAGALQNVLGEMEDALEGMDHSSREMRGH